jgi:hypothetical protein
MVGSLVSMDAVRLKLAGGSVGSWCVVLLPAALGWQRCVLAALLHVPCPLCGMSRAIALLASGRLRASLEMNALAVPVLAGLLALVTVATVTTYRVGTPFAVHRSRLGRAALAGLGVAYAAAVGLWALRWFGWFGGPVAVG